MLISRLISFLLASIYFIVPVWAGETNIRSSGNAYLGKFKYSEIDVTDALLQIELEGRTLLSVKAGYIGNTTYREYWAFEDSYLIYDKVSGHFNENSFTERDAKKYICGAQPEQRCEALKSEKFSKNLVIVTYIDRQTGRSCAALLYVDEEFPSEGYGAYGDYFARSTSCVTDGGGSDEALARSAHYLSTVKKDGRRIANLARYDFPSINSFPNKASTPIDARKIPGDSSAIRSSDGGPTEEFPVAFKWEGVSDLAVGTLTASTKGSEGSVSLKIDAGNCTGKWERKGGKPRTAEGSYGVWFISCGSGLSASGSYEMIGRRNGTGEGRDSDGREVTFVFGR